MVVDDDQDILTTFEAILNSQGISVKTFSDANESIKQFALARPDLYDLIILDIRMPRLNGLQLHYRLKALNKNIKVLFVSALEASDELISILPGIQIENILKKPVPRDYFITTVKRILGVTEGDKMTG
jgi:DNA-binding response OmpR family regulator